jgi:hypothetical protein
LWKENPNRIDEKLVNQKSLYNMIKNKIAKDGKTLPFNTKELYKRIRESIAHNSSTKQNFVYNLENFEMNLGEVDGADFIVELTPEELSKLLVVLVSNLQRNPTHSIAYREGEVASRDDVREKFGIKVIKTNEEKELDNNQVERAYSYFKYAVSDKTVEGNVHNMGRIIAIPDNPETLLADKLEALKMISFMTTSSSWKDVTTEFNGLSKNEEFISVYFAIVSNMLFEIVSSQTNDEIKEMFSGTGIKLNDEEIRHLRNSLCHGRYFHDFNQTFYFYDGRKKLSLGAKLTIKDINKLLDKIALGTHAVVVLP